MVVQVATMKKDESSKNCVSASTTRIIYAPIFMIVLYNSGGEKGTQTLEVQTRAVVKCWGKVAVK